MHYFYRINAYSIILTGYMPGFPPGHSTIVLFCDLSDFYSVRSLLPPRIDRASIPHDSPTKF
jgi:hypothetical protein